MRPRDSHYMIYLGKRDKHRKQSQKEDAMRTLMGTLIVTLASVAPAPAADGSIVKGSSILLILFLGFAALIIVFQFIPGLVLFVSMLKGLFTRSPKKAAETVSGKQGEK